MPKGVLVGIPTGVKEGVKRGGPEGVPVGTTVEIPVGVATGVEGIGSVKSRFRAPLEARAPRADSASGINEDRPDGIGKLARFCAATEARDPRADSAVDTRDETPVGMAADPRFTRGRLMETGCPPRTGNPDGLPDGRAKLVLDGANGVGSEGSHGVSDGVGSPEPLG